MQNILWIIGGILFFCLGLFVVNMADSDINKMMKMTKIELYLTIPVSILLWIYESYKIRNWSIFADKYSIILIYFLIYNIVFLLLISIFYKRIERKKSISLYFRKDNDYFSPENAIFRVYTFSFMTILAGTIWITYIVVVNY